MKRLIIYGSQYGTTKSYAEKLAELTKIPIICDKDIKNLSGYEEIIHFGGIYAGGIKGLNKTIKAISQDTHLVIVTVGLSDVTNEVNTDNIKNAIRQRVPQSILDKTKIFHLRGGIDYEQLSFKHKIMMSMLNKMVKNLPQEQQTPETRDLIETYNQKVNFVDFKELEKIIDDCLLL